MTINLCVYVFRNFPVNMYMMILCVLYSFSLCYYRNQKQNRQPKKLFIESFFSDDFIFFTPATQLKPLALIAEAGPKNSLSIFDRKICFEKGIKMRPKKTLCCAFVKAEAAAKNIVFYLLIRKLLSLVHVMILFEGL